MFQLGRTEEKEEKSPRNECFSKEGDHAPRGSCLEDVRKQEEEDGEDVVDPHTQVGLPIKNENSTVESVECDCAEEPIVDVIMVQGEAGSKGRMAKERREATID